MGALENWVLYTESRKCYLSSTNAVLQFHWGCWLSGDNFMGMYCTGCRRTCRCTIPVLFVTMIKNGKFQISNWVEDTWYCIPPVQYMDITCYSTIWQYAVSNLTLIPTPWKWNPACSIYLFIYWAVQNKYSELWHNVKDYACFQNALLISNINAS